jgi:hypothetical protein
MVLASLLEDKGIHFILLMKGAKQHNILNKNSTKATDPKKNAK